MSMENSNDTIGNRTHDLPACSVQIAITDNVVWTKILGSHYDLSRRTLTGRGGGSLAAASCRSAFVFPHSISPLRTHFSILAS